jgi:glutaredoxin-like protein NrdH
MTKKALEKNGIAFEEVALLPETLEQFASKGFRSAPIVVAGEKSWAGFQPDLINELAA